jgi:hypothetical protein
MLKYMLKDLNRLNHQDVLFKYESLDLVLDGVHVLDLQFYYFKRLLEFCFKFCRYILDPYAIQHYLAITTFMKIVYSS